MSASHSYWSAISLLIPVVMANDSFGTLLSGRFGSVPDRMKKGCEHCPHFPPRTQSYCCRTASDSGRFRDFPVFTRAGMRFESHLGHSVSAGQRLFKL